MPRVPVLRKLARKNKMSIGELVEKMGAASETRKGKRLKVPAFVKQPQPEPSDTPNIHDVLGPQVDLCPELAAHCCFIDGLGPCIKHPLFFSVPHFPQLNGMANKGLQAKKELLVRYRAAKEWGGVIAAHEKLYRFEALAEIQDELSRDDFWAALMDVYIGCENWYEQPNRGLMENWLEEFYAASRSSLRRLTIRKAAMEKGEYRKFKMLPPKLRVFRGFSRDGGELGYSWSLKQSKAAWFGQRMASIENAAGYAYVSWGWVQKSDAVGYFTRRSEDEIFADWQSVEVSSVDICQHATAQTPNLESGETRPIVSFDFDGTLHSDIDAGGNPRSFHSDRLKPRADIVRKLKAAADAGSKVVIVTRRDYGNLGAVLRFCANHRLPVATIYPTHDRPKEPTLATIGAAVHYDDHEINHPGAVKV